MTERTFTIFKPDSLRKGVQGHMLQRLLDEGFRVLGMKLTHLTRAQAEGFYAVHKERPFFPELVTFMTSGPVIVACLERAGAVEKLRAVMGPTDSTKAAPETIRGQFGTDIQCNAIHGSDSPENAAKEISFFFSEAELLAAAHSGAVPAPEGAETWAPPASQRPPREKGR